MEEEIVQFVSTKLYFTPGPIKSQKTDLSKLFFCLHGRREVVVLCSDKLKETLKNLPSDYFQPRLKDIKQYLISQNIQFIENFKDTTTV